VGSTRFVLATLFVAVLSISICHPKSRRALKVALTEARWKLNGGHPDMHYRKAERYFQAGDFEQARLSCLDALKLQPTHPPARALLWEVEFILWQGKATPTTREYDRFMSCPAFGSPEQLLRDMDNFLAKADQFVKAGEPEQAKTVYRKVLEYAKWLTADVDLGHRTERATAGLAHLTAPSTR
jgi:hypothetical protein